jgi:hypothetical protein
MKTARTNAMRFILTSSNILKWPPSGAFGIGPKSQSVKALVLLKPVGKFRNDVEQSKNISLPMMSDNRKASGGWSEFFRRSKLTGKMISEIENAR